MPDWPLGPAMGELIQGLSRHLAEEGLRLILHAGSGFGRPLDDLWKSLRPTAVLSLTELSRDDLEATRATGAAVVVDPVGGEHAPPEAEVLQEQLGRMQVEHLAARGHTRFGYAYPEDGRVGVFADARLTGAAIAAADLDLPGPSEITVPLDAAAAERAVRKWLADDVTAVCAYNDQVALAILAGARRADVAVPQDLAVIGVDDIPAARLADPPLSTVAIDAEAFARHLARAIVGAINGEPAKPPLGPEAVALIPRASS